MLTVLAMVTAPSVQARVYSAHADNLNCHMDIIVDSFADTLNVKWWDDNVGELMHYWYWGGSYIHIWDDDGQIYWFDAPLGTHIIPDGELTFNYSYTNFAVHAEVRWFYEITTYLGYPITVRCDLYVGSSGGGGGGCPTLFVWNGTDYVEEGTLDIHAESDVTVQHKIQNTLAYDGVYKLQLRELDNHTSHIDQVRLYAVDGEGEWHLCALTYAYHNKLGKVKHTLRFDDDNRVDLKPTEVIDLKFTQLGCETAYFIFEINGYNIKTHK